MDFMRCNTFALCEINVCFAAIKFCFIFQVQQKTKSYFFFCCHESKQKSSLFGGHNNNKYFKVMKSRVLSPLRTRTSSYNPETNKLPSRRIVCDRTKLWDEKGRAVRQTNAAKISSQNHLDYSRCYPRKYKLFYIFS